MSFLKAEWRKLAIANYAVAPELLLPYLPAKTELDIWKGTCYVSLVGFMFVNTRLLGIPIPFHRNFEEVNLRFYVKYFENGEWKRGVVFIKEIVPKPALTFVANTLYQEHYATNKMNHEWKETKDHLEVSYGWQQSGHQNQFSLKAKKKRVPILDETEVQFITDHYWGYTKTKSGKTFEYEVTHPRWEAYPVEEYTIDVGFKETYGDDFSFLDNLKPSSVMLAEGSEITVENKRSI